MTKEEFREIMNTVCPEDLQEDWDNSGFQISMPGSGMGRRVLVALDITDQVIDQADMLGADLIVTHHPLFFDPLRSLSFDDPAGRYAIRLSSLGISVYSAHTSFDKMDGGMNDEIGRLLGLRNVVKTGEEGFARCGDLPRTLDFPDFIDHVSESLSLDAHTFRLAGEAPERVSRVSWCGGAGSEFAGVIRENGSELFLTGDLKYHQAKEASESGLTILDIGHFGSEKCFSSCMIRLLREKLPVDTEVFAALGERDGWKQL